MELSFKYRPPKIVRKIFNNFIWETKEDILLTFDDGPNPNSLDTILKELDNKKVKALFFLVGNNIRKYPKLAKEIMSEGHMIANHTYNHNKIHFKSMDFVLNELNKTNEISKELLNYEMKYFRPPHGLFDHKLSSIMKSTHMKCIMWSLITFDFTNDLSIVKKSIEKYLESNSIVTFHDSNKSKEIISDSLKFIFDFAEEKGFSFIKEKIDSQLL